MSVNPGFGGQKYISYTTEKIRKLVEMRESRKYLIEVDGGINSTNIADVYRAGADVFVAGSAVFSQKDRKAAIKKLRTAGGNLK